MSASDPDLPDLSDTRPVSDRALADFERDGHVSLRSVLDPDEVRAYRPVLEAAAMAHNRENRPLGERDTYGRAFLQIVNLWIDDPAVARFVLATRFAGLAAGLLGVDRLRLYHDQALFKEGGGGHTPWHQDQFYWPLDTDRTITMWMPLVDVTADTGAMHFVSGSHRLAQTSDLAIGDQSHAHYESMIATDGLVVDGHAPLAAGDATFHRGWTIHGAPPNASASMRPVMTIIYFADGARITALDHPNRRLDQTMYLPGCDEGEPAESPFCPVVWPRPDETPARPTRDDEYWRHVIDALDAVSPGV